MTIKQITNDDLAALVQRAAASPRRRANHNLHPVLEDPVQRFLNAMEPGTYVRPHRHTTPEPKWELFVAMSGAIAVLLFDDAGVLTERVVVSAAGPVRAIEVPPGIWHTVVVLESGTVLFEFKQGPYAALTDKDFAQWAPREGEAGAPAMLQSFLNALPGSRFGA